MAEGVDYKIRVDDSGLDGAAKKADELEKSLAGAEANQTKKTKEGVNARSQIIRDGLAQNLRSVRETTASEMAVLKDKLKKEEIDQKEYAARYVQITAQAQAQVQAIKGQKAKLLPPEAAQGGSGMSVGLGFAAGAIGVGALSKELVSLAEHSTNAQATVDGLASIVRFKLGQDAVPEATKALKEITKSGLLSQSDGATALKNLISMGYGIDQATQIIQRNTDIAIKNRQAHYSVSESVKVFTEGVKNGNSVLTDATGITENLEPMLKKYGFTAQDLADKVNGAAARQALLKEVMKQTEPFVGDAAKASESFTGVMAKMSQQADETKAALGKIAAEGLTPLFSAFTSIMGGITRFFTGLSETSQKAILFGTILTALAIPVGILITSAYAAAGSFVAMAAAIKASMIALATNPIFLMVAAIAALTTVIVGLIEGGKATPGEQLINEKKQLEELAKAVELTVEQKKRLADINKKIVDEYGPLLEALRLEGAGYDKVREGVYRLDEAKKTLGQLPEMANTAEFAAKLNEVELKILDMRKRVAEKNWPIFGGENYVKAQLKDAEAQQAILLSAATKKPEKKSKDAVRVPVIFVPDETSLQVLKDKQRFNSELLAADQGMYLSIELMRANELNAYEQSLVQKRFALQTDKGIVEASLDDLEKKKIGLEQKAANETDARRKNEIAAAQKHNQQLLDATKRRIDKERELKQKQDDFNREAAGQMFELGQALLSQEEGAFVKFLANKLRALTQWLATKLYMEAVANMSNPLTFGIGLAQLAAGAAVQAAGELGAQAIESGAKKSDPAGGGGSPSVPDSSPPAPAPNGGNSTVVNNVDSRVTINEYGTYMSEAEFIRARVRPELAKIAAERGKVIFK